MHSEDYIREKTGLLLVDPYKEVGQDLLKLTAKREV
jgi:hypothetical protein